MKEHAMPFTNITGNKMEEKILLGHGSGGKLSHDLIQNLFVKHFDNKTLDIQADASVLTLTTEDIAFTTDSFVVDPIFFPGGNIGKLAVCGTVNDLAVSGAKALYLSSSFIIEEGFPYADLEKIVISMAEEAKKAGVHIVTGDTKVVDKTKCDKVFINTTGIGEIQKKHKSIGSGERIKGGDKIIINNYIADHGMAILKARELNRFKANIESDCACLNYLIEKSLMTTNEIHFMRDATRGGLATVLSELVENKRFGIELNEDSIPVRESVRGMCELIGFDPLYVANEGIVLMIVAEKDAEKLLTELRKDELGENASIIGQITEEHAGKAWINTEIGGKRIIDMLAGEQLPRIC
jgi:hydrogenase expression/formation protein HypE